MMGVDQRFGAVVRAHLAVDLAQRERAHTEKRFAIGGATWADLTARIDDVTAAVNERDALLDAVVAHDQEWAHIFDDCPICQASL